LWSFGELVRIGQSTDLERRLLDYSDRDPNKFRCQTIQEYFRRRDAVTRPPSLSAERCINKIEHTEFEWYKQKYGELPRWNKQHKHYEVGVFEKVLSSVL
jgi:hypothetical protein